MIGKAPSIPAQPEEQKVVQAVTQKLEEAIDVKYSPVTQ